MKILVTLAMLVGCSDGDPAPSCQQAIAHYYSIGCTFVELSTGRQVSQGEFTAACQQTTSAAPARCQGEIDTWLTCLNEVTECSTGVCSQEQMALLRCE